MNTVGVMLTAFGGPRNLDAVAPFMHELTGHEPSQQVLERAKRKYLTIGGGSPLPEIADLIAKGLEEEFARARGERVPVRVGMRYSPPYIADAIDELGRLGALRIVMVSLSPFESRIAHGAYREAVVEAIRDRPGVVVVEAPMLHQAPAFREYLGDACVAAMEGVQGEARPLVVFTAHSLPLSDLSDDDPYVAELGHVAEAIAVQAGLYPKAEIEGDERLPGISASGNLDGGFPWVLAYQSKGERPGEWLGPLIEDVVDAAKAGGFSAIAACPIGFATDHMETLYDLDVVIADKVLQLDMEFARADVPNDTPSFVAGIASLVNPLLTPEA